MMLLPVNTKNEPDWAFMESYMQELEQNILKNAISYYAKRISNKISLSLKPEKQQFSTERNGQNFHLKMFLKKSKEERD